MMTETDDVIPRQCDVLVIGGGPAGSSAATLLAKAGIDTVLLEKAVHPRAQVGESVIPHFWKYADLTGASPLIEAQGFVAKAGGITAWNGDIHRISFADFGYQRPALHVERDVFDHLLLKHAKNSGAQIVENVMVKGVTLTSDSPVVHYLDRRGNDAPVPGSIACRYIVDASGYNAFLANHLKSKQPIQSKLKFMSLWGYFNKARYVGLDGKSHAPDELATTKPVTFVLSFKEGWIWHIILRKSTSVGLVIHTDRVKGMDRGDRERFFLDVCRNTQHLNKLLAPAQYIEDSLCARPDYSYYSTRVCEENYYCIGDSGGFVDPIFSQGVFNAFYSGTLAAIAIQESLKDPTRRKRYAQLCENRIRQFYSFSRALALGDLGANGVDPDLVKAFVRSVPTVELELMLAASHITHRASHFRQLAELTGLSDGRYPVVDKGQLIGSLEI